MTNVEDLLMQIRHVKVFLESAETALQSPSGDQSTKIDAAAVVLGEAEIAFRDLVAKVGEPRRFD